MNLTWLRRPVVIIITLDHLQESLAQVKSTGMLLQSWKLLLAKQRTDVAFLQTMQQSDRNHQRRGRRTESDVCNAVWFMLLFVFTCLNAFSRLDLYVVHVL